MKRKEKDHEKATEFKAMDDSGEPKQNKKGGDLHHEEGQKLEAMGLCAGDVVDPCI
jgi:hypothetical protein